ncbi:MAG: tRNA threonylcarbamoyladenosine dehydratase [Pontiellaceae bacterium]|nr:tRNA threonylcarbamoyladenosine dehydratase [Pontiellaceae bacterium]MBN2783938.1 tRNA threonylcarbamoyladenosine dehydratase [Pontiellaceae bacterium]
MSSQQPIETGGYEHRFGGLFRLYGKPGMERLRNAHVLIVGVGGVGSWVAEALARSSIGRLTLVDWDDICFSNTNRQVHAMTGTAGRAKVDILAERIRLINPECAVTAIREFYSDRNADELIQPGLSYVVDAIDKKNAKIHLITHCRQLDIPVIVSGGAGGRVDPSQIRVTDLRDSYNDPLLASIRKQLRRNLGMRNQHKNKFQIPCAFSAEEIRYPHPDGGFCYGKPAAGEGPKQLDCQFGFGSATFVTGSFGFAMAARIINDLVQS